MTLIPIDKTGNRFTHGIAPGVVLDIPQSARIINAAVRAPLRMSDYWRDQDSVRPGCMDAFGKPSRGIDGGDRG